MEEVQGWIRTFRTFEELEAQVSGGGGLAIAKGLGLGAALKTVVGTTTGKVAAAGVAGAAVGSAMKGRRKGDSSKSSTANFKTGTIKTPQYLSYII